MSRLLSESTPYCSRQPHQVSLPLTCIFPTTSLCWLTTFTIHNSPTLLLLALNIPLSQIFPTIDSLPASGLTPRTYWLNRLFWASCFCLFCFLHYTFLVPCAAQLSWLPVSFWAHKNRIVSYSVGTLRDSGAYRRSLDNNFWKDTIKWGELRHFSCYSWGDLYYSWFNF